MSRPYRQFTRALSRPNTYAPRLRIVAGISRQFNRAPSRPTTQPQRDPVSVLSPAPIHAGAFTPDYLPPFCRRRWAVDSANSTGRFRSRLHDYDFIWASPPCQRQFTRALSLPTTWSPSSSPSSWQGCANSRGRFHARLHRLPVVACGLRQPAPIQPGAFAPEYLRSAHAHLHLSPAPIQPGTFAPEYRMALKDSCLSRPYRQFTRALSHPNTIVGVLYLAYKMTRQFNRALSHPTTRLPALGRALSASPPIQPGAFAPDYPYTCLCRSVSPQSRQFNRALSHPTTVKLRDYPA